MIEESSSVTGSIGFHNSNDAVQPQPVPSPVYNRHAPPPSAKPSDETTAMLAGVRVLVADDSSDNLFLIRRILNKDGLIVDTVSNGVEAFQTGMKGPYDIVLMDIQMPEMDGYEATRSLRGAGFKKPIIALTAHAMAEERARSFAAGCDGHLTKPLNRVELLETIRKHVCIQPPVAPSGS